MNPLELIDRVDRLVTVGERDGLPTKIVIMRRSFDASAADVWDAITNAERIPRWFLPVSGDLRLGGQYQLEGNAGGVIESCRPPELIKLTWVYDGETSWVEVRLSADSPQQTTLELSHEAPVNDHWRTYGPGAAGVGWDISLIGLDEHLATGGTVVEEEWTGSDSGRDALRRSSEEWGRAAVAAGENPTVAKESADRTMAAYTAVPE